MKRWSLVLLCVWSVACHQKDDGKPKPEPHSAATQQGPEPVATTMVALLDPNGSRWVGVLFDIDKGWHIYGNVSGDSGLPTRVEWQLPQQVSASKVHYPSATRFTDTGDIVTYGYTDEVLLLSEIALQKGASSPVHIGAKVSWLACQASRCLPGDAELRQALPTQPTKDQKIMALFQRYKPTTLQ